jgi:2-amino-4-hydroxy-6-hydroxymethyldihydropteridine diphosphokinase
VSELAYVALGSNLGDRAAHLDRARAAISLLPATRLEAVSSVEETAPLGAMAQSPYLNQMLAVRTRMAPMALLRALHGIEAVLGRVRTSRWAPRTIDLDLVRYGDRRMNDAALTLPHPGLPRRDFWRRELRELDAILAESV